MFQLFEKLHLMSTKHKLKLAPEKSFFMLLKGLGFSNDWLLMIRQNTLLNPTLPHTLKISNMAFCNCIFIFADFLRSSFIFPDLVRRLYSQFLHLRRLASQFLHLRRLSSQFIIFADFLCSPLNLNSLTFKLQPFSN